MRRVLLILSSITLMISFTSLNAQEGLVPLFRLESNDLTLERLARPGTPFNKLGSKFAILGDESGSFEAWAYPLKLFRNFEFSFLVGSSTRPIQGKDIVRYVSVSPEATTLTYTYQSFTIKATYITPVDEPGAIILLKVESTEPLTVVCGFLPALQPMWPAGLGGQYAFWDDEIKAYIISESSGKNHGIVGSPAALGISYTPAHMLADAPFEFKIDVPDPNTVKDKYIPVFMAGGKGPRDDILNVYEKLKSEPETYYRKNLAHYKSLRKDTLQIHTPDQRLNLAFEWAKIAFDNLIVSNPDLGKGLVAGLGASGTSGRPGFGWFFGGDTYINSLSFLSYGAFQTVRDALAFTQKWQRKDGKMAHEVSQAAGYIDWWNDYHYGYIHGDTTPYYIAAMYDYVKMSGDSDFIKESWDSLKIAYEWCLATDANGDGLMDNKKAGLGALEYGALTGIETDVYLAAVWVRATYAMQYLAELSGKKSYSAAATQDFEKAKKAFNEKFWDGENQFYAYAFNSAGDHVKEISPWNALGIMWDFGTSERSKRSLEKICSSELTTDWGIRSISASSPHFQPLNYNYGAVWPFLTSWVTTALYKHHMPLQAYSLLKSTARHTFDHALGSITEVFSGTQNIWPQEAVSHQGFSSAGVILPLVRGLLGLEGDALNKTINFAPHFPANWEQVSIYNYRVGKSIFAFAQKRNKDKIEVRIQAKNAEGFSIQFAPALGIGHKINALKVDGAQIPFQESMGAQTTQALADIKAKNETMLVEMDYIPALEILPVFSQAKVGDSNKGLKIISVQREDSKMDVKVEGLAGKLYELGVVNAELIESLQGARLEAGTLRFQIPEGEVGNFVFHHIKIHVRDPMAR